MSVTGSRLITNMGALNLEKREDEAEDMEPSPRNIPLGTMGVGILTTHVSMGWELDSSAEGKTV